MPACTQARRALGDARRALVRPFSSPHIHPASSCNKCALYSRPVRFSDITPEPSPASCPQRRSGGPISWSSFSTYAYACQCFSECSVMASSVSNRRSQNGGVNKNAAPAGAPPKHACCCRAVAFLSPAFTACWTTKTAKCSVWIVDCCRRLNNLHPVRPGKGRAEATKSNVKGNCSRASPNLLSKQLPI